MKLYEEANTYAVKFHQYPDRWYPLPHVEAYKVLSLSKDFSKNKLSILEK